MPDFTLTISQYFLGVCDKKCENGGKCVWGEMPETGFKQTCLCSDGYSGERCEKGSLIR